MSEDFLKTLAPLIERLNQTLAAILSDSGGFATQVGLYGLEAGGKRLRPLMFCLACESLGQPLDEGTVRLSTAFELLHLATLFHDDIIDMSETRRGQPAAHRAFGVPEAVLAADYLMAKSAEVALSTNNMACFQVFVHIIKELSLGELDQLKNQNEVQLSREAYELTIYRKTAALMEGVGLTAGLWLAAKENLTEALGAYGRGVGLAFQIIDDVLDYEGQANQLGKPVGQDLDEGRITLPFILARDQLPAQARKRLLALGSQRFLKPEDKAEIIDLVIQGQGVQAAKVVATAKADQAIAALGKMPPSPGRERLTQLSLATLAREK
ncbi:MAG: polyprenyl synthetase family protein [Deltaproteobacteria bacterium]|jgi:octaprenyl-diphosphate synthase|nr:polyprenyl synthetase family protein [Deltaproteobacteria bacterium]